jgi:hypothetical protein
MVFKAEILGTVVGVCKCVSLAAKCITVVTFVLPEADNKSLLVGFPILGFSLAGCQNLSVHMCFVTVVHCYFPLLFA